MRKVLRNIGYAQMRVTGVRFTLALMALLAFGLALPGGSARAEGEVEWMRQYGTGRYDSADAVAATRWGVYVGGSAGGTLSGPDQSGSGNIYLRKLNAAGDVLWTRQFGGGGSIQAIGADFTGVYVAGYVTSALPGQTHAGFVDVFVRKYDHTGVEEWTRQFGSPDVEFVNGLAVNGSSVYVVGQTEGALEEGRPSAGGYDGFVRKLSQWGGTDWTRQFGTTGHDGAGGVAVDSSGVYVAGSTGGSLVEGQANTGGSDAILRKYTATGDVIYTRQFGAADNEFFGYGDIALDASGVYMSGGITTQIAQNELRFRTSVRKHNAAGDSLWAREVSATGSVQNGGIALDSTGVYLAGTSQHSLVTDQPSPGGWDGFIGRYTLEGQPVSTRMLEGEGHDYVRGISANSTGVYLVGGTNDALLGGSHVGGFDAYLLKLPAPAAPVVAANSATVTVDEGRTATINGTYNDRNADNVALMASEGTLTKTGTSTGTWSVSLPAGDGPATKTVTITADDGTGRSSAVTVNLVVRNVAPAATFNKPASANEGSTITVSLTSPVEPGADDRAVGFTYAFDCGDGTGYRDATRTNNATCLALDNPRQTVKGKIIDRNGGAREYVAGVPVLNLKPTARFNAPVAVQPGSVINVSLTRATDPGPRDRRAGYEYAFDCGDGSGFAISASPSETCEVGAGPKQTLKARIYDKDGAFSEYVKSVIVDGAAPTGTAVINAGAATTKSPVVSVKVTATDNTGGSGLRYVRISNSPAVADDVLTQGRTFAYNAATPTLSWNLTNASYGGTDAAGAKKVYVQWRDAAGNWSDVVSDTITHAP